MRVLVQEKVPAGSYTPLAEEIVQVKYPLTEAYALKAAHAAHLSFHSLSAVNIQLREGALHSQPTEA